MDIHETVKYAREYLHRSMFRPKPIEEYRLNRRLQYLLCQAFERFDKEFGEITKRDVVYLVEAWIMGASAADAFGYADPLVLHHHTPE